MTTLGQLLSLTRFKLDEAGIEGTWKHEELRRYIQEGVRDVARRTECLRGSTTVGLGSGGVQTVNAPTDVIRIHTISWYRNSDPDRKYPLEYMDLRTIQSAAGTSLNQTEGTPCVYTTWGFPPALEITVFPIPSEASTLLVHYYLAPAEYINTGDSDDLEIGLPTGWEELCSDYGVFQALLKDGDPRWQAWQQIYEAKLGGLAEAAERFNDQAGQMVPVGNTFYPHWLVGMGDGWD